MTHAWTRRLIEVVLVFAFVAEIWRFFTTKNTSQVIISDMIQLVGLVIIGLVCLYAEVCSSRFVK
jgi:Ca2+/H+ antiporter